MEPLFFVMAIMGCGDGTTQCAEARIEPVRYATVRQCQAAMPAALHAQHRYRLSGDQRDLPLDRAAAGRRLRQPRIARLKPLALCAATPRVVPTSCRGERRCARFLGSSSARSSSAIAIIRRSTGSTLCSIRCPLDLDPSDDAATSCLRHRRMPLGAELLSVGGWFIGALWRRLARAADFSDRRWVGWIVALLVHRRCACSATSSSPQPCGCRSPRSWRRCSAAWLARAVPPQALSGRAFTRLARSRVRVRSSAMPSGSGRAAMPPDRSAPTLCAVARLRNSVASKLARVEGGGVVRLPPDKARDSLTDNTVMDRTLWSENRLPHHHGAAR